MADEIRLTMLISPELRDKITAMGKAEQRTMMRQAEALIREAIAAREAKVAA
jgi:hypothetical protein